SDAQVAAKGVTLTGGQWVHIVARYDGTTRALYLNGQLLVQDSAGANGGTNANFAIGVTNNFSEFFSGLLDDVAIWNEALSVPEIQNLAAGGSPLSGPRITSFSADKATAYEGESVQLSWAVDTSQITGSYSFAIMRGTTTLTSGTAVSGTHQTAIPDLVGSAQNITYTFTATETGGDNVTRSAHVRIAAAPRGAAAAPATR